MDMMLSLIVAMAENRVIGANNRLPWHLPADLKHFRALTMGHPIIMGRKTFDSIGRVLPGRRNIVVTRNPEYKVEGLEIAHSLEGALELCGSESEAFIIGGAHLYEAALPHVQRIYLTLVHTVVEGDVLFPALDPSAWQVRETTSHGADEKNPCAYDFVIYERRPL